MLDIYPYQTLGAEWLAGRKYAILGDQMRLGKTPQAIRAADLVGARKILVICLKVGRTNWVEEFKQFSDIKRTYLAPTSATEFLTKFHSVIDVTILTYGLLTNKKILDKLSGTAFDMLIIDEAHYAKSSTAARTKAIYGAKGVARLAKRVYALSGTIAPNTQFEMWTHLRAFGATKLKEKEFKYEFFHVDDYDNVRSVKADKLPALNKIINSVMLRRTKQQVRADLPDIRYSNIYIDPSPVDIERWFANTENLNEQLIEAREVLQEVLMRDPDNPVILETESISTYLKYTGLSKVPAVVELAEWFLDSNEKLIIFARHRAVIESLKELLIKYNPAVIYGGTSKPELQVQKFMTDNRCKVFIGNITSAGTSISLTAASTVWFCEASFVPGDNAQAAMRVQGPSQKEACIAEFITLKDSTDELVQRSIARKTKNLSKTFE
jgi:SWI/SNF-related matrix-associated actin-dependent regulator 1 of chromatin subfamily A